MERRGVRPDVEIPKGLLSEPALRRAYELGTADQADLDTDIIQSFRKKAELGEPISPDEVDRFVASALAAGRVSALRELLLEFVPIDIAPNP